MTNTTTHQVTTRVTMTAARLIEKLQALDPDASVFIETGDGLYTVDTVLPDGPDIFITMGAMP